MRSKDFLTQLYLNSRKKRKNYEVVAKFQKKEKYSIMAVEVDDDKERIIVFLGK